MRSSKPGTSSVAANFCMHTSSRAVCGGLCSHQPARRPLIAHEHTFEAIEHAPEVGLPVLLIAPSARRIICVSNPVASSLVAEGVSPGLLEVVPNGVPTTAILDRSAARAELGVDAARSVIGMVGRLRREKRHDLAIEALALLRDKGVDVTLCNRCN